MFRTTCAALALTALSTTAFASSSLGISGAALQAGLDDGDAFASLTFDAAITEFHGLQGTAALEDGALGLDGRLNGHLYMTPRPGEKYGFVGFLSDFNDRDATYGGLGMEGLFALSDFTAVELRGGIGLADGGQVDDFIFAEAGIYHGLTDSVGVSLAGTLAEFDETDFSALGYDLRLGLSVQPERQPYGIFAEVRYDGLTGSDSADGETTLRAGISFEFGNMRRGGPESRPFSSPDPLGTLIRREIF